MASKTPCHNLEAARDALRDDHPDQETNVTTERDKQDDLTGEMSHLGE